MPTGAVGRGVGPALLSTGVWLTIFHGALQTDEASPVEGEKSPDS